MAKMLKQGSVHKEPHNPAFEYSNKDGGDYLDPNEELAELMIDGHKAYYGQDAKGTVPMLPKRVLGEQESSTAGDMGGIARGVR